MKNIKKKRIKKHSEKKFKKIGKKWEKIGGNFEKMFENIDGFFSRKKKPPKGSAGWAF